MRKIEFSAVISTCGRETLNEAVDSAAYQSYAPSEIIIAYDGESAYSTFLKDIPTSINNVPIKILEQGKKTGIGSICRNLGARQAKYEYLAFLDDDDLWAEQKLEKYAEAITLQDFDFIYSNTNLFDNAYRIFDYKNFEQFYSKDRSQLKLNMMKFTATGSTSTYVIRKRIFDELDGFDETMLSAQDYEFSLRIIADDSIKIGFLNEPLLYYRYNTLKKISLTPQLKVDGMERILKLKEKLFPELYKKYEEVILSFHYYSIALAYLLAGETTKFQEISLKFSLENRNYLRLSIIKWLVRLKLFNFVSEVKRILGREKYLSETKKFRQWLTYLGNKVIAGR